MGATEAPTTITGAWKDRFIGDTTTEPCIAVNGVAVLTARDAIKLFDSICREGQELEVTWDEDVRVGFLEDFESSRQNIHDVEWSMQFAWISRGQAATAVVLASSVSLASTASTARQRLNTMRRLLQNPPYPLIPQFQNTIAAAMVEFEVDVQNIEGAASTVAVLATAPIDASRSVIAACNSLVSTGKELRDYFDSFVPGLTNQITSVATQSYGQSLASLDYTRELQAESSAMVNFAVESRSEYSARIESDLLGIYESRQGDDLRTVSQAYYNTPFQWRTLATFNLLEDVTLQPGTVVLIPKLTALATS
jgi:hypothetical protein